MMVMLKSLISSFAKIDKTRSAPPGFKLEMTNARLAFFNEILFETVGLIEFRSKVSFL